MIWKKIDNYHHKSSSYRILRRFGIIEYRLVKSNFSTIGVYPSLESAKLAALKHRWKIK